MPHRPHACLCALVAVLALEGCGGSGVNQYVRTKASTIALTHVRVIDGTGGPGKDDQTVVIQNGHISAVGGAVEVKPPSGAEVLDLSGRTVIPGLVGMHEHLFYQIEQPPSGTIAVTAPEAFAKLYLANGVTTIRTGGTIDFDGDLRIKRLIDGGKEAGLKIHLTGPYLSATGSEPDPDRIRREVVAQSERGATSMKAYTTLRKSELRAAIEAAHERGLRVTGHLCAVGYREAAALGIDNLEHGIFADSEFYSGKRSDVCPDQGAILGELLNMNMTDSAVLQTIWELVRHGISVTSTLAVIESYTARDSVPDPRIRPLLASRIQDAFDVAQKAQAVRDHGAARFWAQVLRMEMQFERQFVAAGGTGDQDCDSEWR